MDEKECRDAEKEAADFLDRSYQFECAASPPSPLVWNPIETMPREWADGCMNRVPQGTWLKSVQDDGEVEITCVGFESVVNEDMTAHNVNGYPDESDCLGRLIAWAPAMPPGEE